jgi:propanediol dehydratase small subunit
VNQTDLEKMIKDIILNIGGNGSSQTQPTPACSCGEFTYEDYPLAEKSTDKLRTPTGKGINEVTLEALLAGNIRDEDVRITPETLEMQAQVAESRGRVRLAANMRRAAEMIAVPDERILEIYNAMRPYRSTKKELYGIAEELESQYSAKVTAGLIREAADVGEARGRLKVN